MALPETLECLSSLLEEGGSVCLYERGDYQTVPRHPDFRFSIFLISNLVITHDIHT
jgi:midasin (ATPase involved in ribosome maturation)